MKNPIHNLREQEKEQELELAVAEEMESYSLFMAKHAIQDVLKEYPREAGFTDDDIKFLAITLFEQAIGISVSDIEQMRAMALRTKALEWRVKQLEGGDEIEQG